MSNCLSGVMPDPQGPLGAFGMSPTTNRLTVSPCRPADQQIITQWPSPGRPYLRVAGGMRSALSSTRHQPQGPPPRDAYVQGHRLKSLVCTSVLLLTALLCAQLFLSSQSTIYILGQKVRCHSHARANIRIALHHHYPTDGHATWKRPCCHGCQPASHSTACAGVGKERAFLPLLSRRSHRYRELSIKYRPRGPDQSKHSRNK